MLEYARIQNADGKHEACVVYDTQEHKLYNFNGSISDMDNTEYEATKKQTIKTAESKGFSLNTWIE